MDQIQNALIEQMKSFSSAEAAAWLMEKFPLGNPDYWRAFELFKHRSWKKSEQVALCRYYMQKVPFANARPYEAFARTMSLRTFLAILKEVQPSTEEDLQLFLYHVKSALNASATTAADKEEVRLFLLSME